MAEMVTVAVNYERTERMLVRQRSKVEEQKNLGLTACLKVLDNEYRQRNDLRYSMDLLVKNILINIVLGLVKFCSMYT